VIYGIGLPRTGSSSLAAALRILGYEGSSWCALHAEGEVSPTLKEFWVDNGYYETFGLFDIHKDDKVILTTRNADDWRASIERQREHTEHRYLVLPDISTYEQQVRWQVPSNQLLVVSWDEGHRWEKLCAFLGHPVPDVPFPCVNC